jgi:hypothetical protein
MKMSFRIVPVWEFWPISGLLERFVTLEPFLVNSGRVERADGGKVLSDGNAQNPQTPKHRYYTPKHQRLMSLGSIRVKVKS